MLLSDEDFSEDEVVYVKSKVASAYDPFEAFAKQYLFVKCDEPLSDYYKEMIKDINEDDKGLYDKKITILLSPDQFRKFLIRSIKYFGLNGNYNWIDTSKCASFMNLFSSERGRDFVYFNGDISRWNTSSLTNMFRTFFGCANFERDITNWDFSKVKIVNNNTFDKASESLKKQFQYLKREKRFTGRNPKMAWA